MLDHLRATFSPISEVQYDTQFELVRTVSLLIWDDLGTEAATPWAREKLYQLFNHRYQEHLPTVVTSNRRLDELEPRVASRLSDCLLSQVIQIEVPYDPGSRVAGMHGRVATQDAHLEKECVQ